MCVNVEELTVKILSWPASPCNKKKSGFSDGGEGKQICVFIYYALPYLIRNAKTEMLKLTGRCLAIKQTHCSAMLGDFEIYSSKIGFPLSH